MTLWHFGDRFGITVILYSVKSSFQIQNHKLLLVRKKSRKSSFFFFFFFLLPTAKGFVSLLLPALPKESLLAWMVLPEVKSVRMSSLKTHVWNPAYKVQGIISYCRSLSILWGRKKGASPLRPRRDEKGFGPPVGYPGRLCMMKGVWKPESWYLPFCFFFLPLLISFTHPAPVTVHGFRTGSLTKARSPN